MPRDSADVDAAVAMTPATLEVVQGLGVARGPKPVPDEVLDVALERLAAARAANLKSRSRSSRAMALYVGALGVLGAQVLLIAIVQLLGS